MAYNLTEITSNTTGLLTFMQSVNNVLLDGWMGNLILLGLSAVLFISFYFATQDLGKTMIGTSVIAFGLSILLRAMLLTSDMTIFITLLVLAFSTAFTMKR